MGKSFGLCLYVTMISENVEEYFVLINSLVSVKWRILFE